MSSATGSDETAALYDLIASQRITAVIYVTARLGIADVLADGPASARELARRVEAHEPSLERLLRALVTLGVCRRRDDDEFELTGMGMHLTARAPRSLK